MQKDFFVKVVKIFQRSMDILCSRWNTWRRRTWAATWSVSSRRELSATSSTWRLSICPTTSALKYELELNMTSGMLKLCLRHNKHHHIHPHHLDQFEVGVDIDGHICGTFSTWKVFCEIMSLICYIMKWFTDTQQAEAFFKHDHHTGVWCLQPPDKHTKGFIIQQ